jgi:hypothetical protein
VPGGLAHEVILLASDLYCVLVLHGFGFRLGVFVFRSRAVALPVQLHPASAYTAKLPHRPWLPNSHPNLPPRSPGCASPGADRPPRKGRSRHQSLQGTWTY